MVNPYRAVDEMPTKQDVDHLQLLSVLFYCYAALASLVAISIGAFGLLPAALIAAAPSNAHDAPPLLLGGILFMVFGAIAGVLLLKAVLMVLGARALAGRRNYTLVLVAACLALPNVPLGTALGIFTLILLQKPAIKALFR